MESLNPRDFDVIVNDAVFQNKAIFFTTA